MARRILRDELQQRGIAKVISTFEEHTPLRDIGMLHEMYSQGGGIACIEKIDCPAEYRILDALMMRQVQTVGQRRLLDVALQAGPTGKSRFARDGELDIAELQLGSEDFRVRRTVKSRVKFAEALRYFRQAGDVSLQQVLRLMLEVVEIGIGREWF